MHYSNAYDDNGYNDILVRGCMDAGICAFTGDGKDPNIMINATRIIKEIMGMVFQQLNLGVWKHI